MKEFDWSALEKHAKYHWETSMTDAGERQGYIQLATRDMQRYEIERNQWNG